MLDTLVMQREAQPLGWETPTAESDQVLGAVIRSYGGARAGVAIPLSADDQLLGLLLIRDDRMRDAYSPDELGAKASYGSSGR